MYQLLKTLSRLHRENYIRRMDTVIKQKLTAGLVYAWDDIAACHNMKGNLEKAGINLQVIFVPGSIVWPADIDGIPVVPFAEIKARHIQLDIVLLLLGEPWTYTLHSLLCDCGYKTLMVMDTDYGKRNYDFLLAHLPELGEAYAMLGDEESRRVFCAYIMGYYGGSLDDYRFAPEAQYMLPGYMPGQGDIVIDGGAYDGQSARDFSLMGAKVYSFELDKKNYRECLKTADEYGFTVENAGLGKGRGTMRYNSSGAGSTLMIPGEEIAEIVDIDTYMQEKKLNRLDYLKLDVEGAELDTLTGAVLSIGRDKPKMAVSAYHKPEDLWQLIRYIHSLRPDYEFSLRHYKIDGRNYWLEDMAKAILQKCAVELFTPTKWELVLYCR